MTIHHSYLMVEGPQDVFFLGTLLQSLGLRAAENVEDVPDFWSVFRDIGKYTLHQGQKRGGRKGLRLHEVFDGACLNNMTHSIVIQRVDGNLKKFRRKMQQVNAVLDGGLAACNSIGVFPDADLDAGPVFQSAVESLKQINLTPPLSTDKVLAGSPRIGVFPFPGNSQPGGLEQLLLDCAQTVYPTLYTNAKSYVDSIDLDDDIFTDEDTREMRTPQGPKKAIVGSIASVLKPGSTAQVSVLRDRWVSEESLKVQSVKSLVSFLKDLCEL